MRIRRTRRLLTHWVVILAILLTSLAPAISQALGSNKSVSWIEVCSAQGSKRVQSSSDDSTGAPASAQLLEHCPCCSMQVPMLGLPSALDTGSLSLDLKYEFPLAFLAAPCTLYAWVHAQPRAPPLSS